VQKVSTQKINIQKFTKSNQTFACVCSFNDDKTAKPYSQVPGPKGLPFIGNSWRFAPLIGKSLVYKIPL
jgi:hypothetical protein